MTKAKKVTIAVRLKGHGYGEPGPVIATINRVVWLEVIGNFSPMFCRYKGRRELVQSLEGDLSDPFRRDETYLQSLYIEPDPKAAIRDAMSVIGSIKTAKKAASSRINGRKGGKPRMEEATQ